MVEDWFEDGFKKPHVYGENVLVSPKTTLFIPARINLKAIIETDRKIELRKYASLDKKDRGVPSLFWCENLSFSGKNTYTFKTKYCIDSDDILPISYLKQIPERLCQEFLREVPGEISELADRLVGKEKDTRKILTKFYVFVVEHLEPKSPTTGKPIEQLLKEYQNEGCFYGNCKEARDFYIALCDSRGYPTKRVSGKSALPIGHVWADVFVPVKDGYKLFPVDPALIYFGELDPMRHLFFEYTPKMPVEDKACTKEKYKLKIEME